MKIFLDDERKIPDGFIGVSTPNQCIEMLELFFEVGEKVEILSLDHDLGLINPDTLEEETGYDVLCWLEEHTWAMPAKIVIHSANPVGRRRMQMVLDAIERRENG